MMAPGFPFNRPMIAIVLSAEFGARHVFDAYDSAVRRFAHHDLSKLLGRSETALRANGVGEFLTFGHGRPADLSGRVHGVLRLDCAHDFRHRDRELGELIGLDPQAHGILARAEDLYVADARHACELIVQVDVRVIGEEIARRMCRSASTVQCTISGAVTDFCTVTPKFVTSAGS